MVAEQDGREIYSSGLNRENVKIFFSVFHIYLTACDIVGINMSLTTRGSKKLSRDAPEGDFDTFVRELLTRLCEGQNKIIQDISSLRVKVQSNEAAINGQAFETIYDPQPNFRGA